MKEIPNISRANEPVLKVMAYLRMSAEHKKYSTSNQMDAIREHASQKGMEIVRVYSDEGIAAE